MDGYSQSNLLLTLMRLDRNDPNPLRLRSGPLAKDGTYYLLTGILDPTHRNAIVPIGIDLDGLRREIYNRVLVEFQEISAKFYRESGFIEKPDSYTDERQGEILAAMSSIGRLIYDLFPLGSSVRDWLDRLLSSNGSGSRPTQSVTILTNDLSLPWYWLKAALSGPFLCEVCFLGLMPLKADKLPDACHLRGRKDKVYEALLIKGLTSSPFQDEELDMITSFLRKADRGAARIFNAHKAKTANDIWNLLALRQEKLLNDFRIVHFSGNYSDEKLLLGDRQIPISVLEDVLESSLLVLHGTSNGRGSKAWSDVEGLSWNFMDKHGLGCVMSVLPVKHDPIAGKVLWEAFYRELRRPERTIGQALVKARIRLRNYFMTLGSQNPMWAAYQLIGNPSVQLCNEADESG